MPTAGKSSAEKRNKQDKAKRVQNKARIASIRTAAKKVVTAVAAKSNDLAKETMIAFASKIDTAARKGTVKKATAARKKSRLQKQVNSLNP